MREIAQFEMWRINRKNPSGNVVFEVRGHWRQVFLGVGPKAARLYMDPKVAGELQKVIVSISAPDEERPSA